VTVPAAAIRKMVTLGLDAEAIADLCEVIESGQKTVPDALEKRRAYDRERKAEMRKSGGSPVDTVSVKSGGKSGGSPPENHPSRVRDNLLDSLDSVEDTPETKVSSVCQTTKKTRRCPPDWLPNSTTLIAIDATTFTAGEIERELAKFRDHQYRDAHTDWDAAFRNWIRTADERRPQNANGPSPKFVARQANLGRSERGFDAALRYREARDG
jgi:hypothetical protein